MFSIKVSVEEYGKVLTTTLVPGKIFKLCFSFLIEIMFTFKGGKGIWVTNANRGQFVQLYLEWILNLSVKERFRAFYLGFHSVCASNALIMLRYENKTL